MKNTIILFFLFAAFHLKAQDTLKIENISLGGNMNTGNSASFQIASKASISYQGSSSKHGLILSPDYFLLYTGSTDNKMVKKSEDFRSDLFGWRELRKNYSIIAFGDVEHSYSKRIDLRIAGGVGIKKSISSKRIKSSSSIAALYDRTTLSDREIKNVRASFRENLSLSLPGFLINSVVLYQPAIWSESSFLYGENLNLTTYVEISKKISKTVSVGISHETWTFTLGSRVNPGIKPTDSRVSLVFTYKK